MSQSENEAMRRILVTAAALAVMIGGAIGAGTWSNLPIVGQGSFCPGQTIAGIPGTAGICTGGTVPAGPPALTGTELVPIDIPGSQTQSTVTVPISLLGGSTNRLVGGDMTTNLAQRLNTAKGVTALATLSPTAAVMTADRWWVIAPAAGVTVTIDSTAATAVIPGFNNTKALRIARTSSGAAGLTCVGQTLDQAAAQPLIGNNAVFSFYEFNGAGMSAANGQITVNVDYFTAADTAGTQATLGFAGGNGSLSALGDVGLASAGPTNFNRGIAGVSPGTTGAVTAGVATIPASTTWTRYAVYAPIPINAPGTTTPVTGVSVSVCVTFVATTAITTDYIELSFLQLEAKPATVTASLPSGVISPSGVDRRLAAVEQSLQQYYLYFNYEQQSLGLAPEGTCANLTTSSLNCQVVFPVPMRIVPVCKFTDGFQAFVQVAETSIGAMTGLALPTALAQVVSTKGLTFKAAATTVGAAGTINEWLSLGTSSATGIISCSAEP
jgi:hypothetical protein